jgi:hypothetical protein
VICVMFGLEQLGFESIEKHRNGYQARPDGSHTYYTNSIVRVDVGNIEELAGFHLW